MRRRDVLGVRSDGIAQIGPGEKQVREGDQGDGDDRDIEAPEGDGDGPDLRRPGAPQDSDGMLPDRLGDVDDDEGEPERRDEGDQLALEAHGLLAAQLAVQEAEVETHAHDEADRRVDRDAEEGIESAVQVEEIRPVRPEHDEFPMGDVDDLRDAPDDVQPMRDDGEDAAEQEAEHQVCEEERHEVGHGLPGP